MVLPPVGRYQAGLGNAADVGLRDDREKVRRAFASDGVNIEQHAAVVFEEGRVGDEPHRRLWPLRGALREHQVFGADPPGVA